MSTSNSEVVENRNDLKLNNKTTQSNRKGKLIKFRAVEVLLAILLYAFVNFFIELKFDIYGEIYARYIATDIVETEFNIDHTWKVTKNKRKGGTSKSYSVDISYEVDGTVYHRTIPGLGKKSDIDTMNYKYSKAHPSLGYTDATNVSFYIDFAFLGAAFLFVLYWVIGYIISRIKLVSKAKSN